MSVPDLRGDKEQLIQALLNIVRNAAQALRERIAQGDAKIELRTRIARKVTIAKRLYRLALDLHVIDNRPGIPEKSATGSSTRSCPGATTAAASA